ncbi:syntaxin-binding protein 5-like [Saccoglossus kowalevskii]
MSAKATMKKFASIGRVLDGLRSGSTPTPKAENEIVETLSSEDFTINKVVRHGFPYKPSAMAYDPVQHILVIGSENGSLRIFGQPGVDCHVRHDEDVAVLQLIFLVNEGALVSVCADDSLHLWNLRQKKPAILHSLKFNRERITYTHLPFQSKWLYIGTERGNIHIVNIESFILSGYVINWNKAIELSRKTHPGPVVHLSDNPIDSNKLLIGFESGALVLWDLRNKQAEYRYSCSAPLRSVSWNHEGKQFMCSHTDGSLSLWHVRTTTKPHNIMYPHARPPLVKGARPDPCTPINKVEWRTCKGQDPYIIFSGGLSYEKAAKQPSLTIMQGKNTTVLEMEHPIMDFMSLCETPWPSDIHEPYAIVVLLENDMVVVDLNSPGYPCFENPYPMDLHESPVTCVQYYADCPPDIIPALYSVGSSSQQKKRMGYSKKEWPVKGGEWGTGGNSYPEIIITGHADGSLKFWDASAVTLQVLYKLKTAKVFEKKGKSVDGEEDPYAIQIINMCLDSRLFCVAGASGHVILFRYSKQEAQLEQLTVKRRNERKEGITSIEISIVYEAEELESPDCELPPTPIGRNASTSSSSTAPHMSSSSGEGVKDNVTNIKVRSGGVKFPPGYQPDVICQFVWMDGEPPPTVTSLECNSAYGLMAIGTANGIAIVDFIQKTCLLNMGTPDLYGSADPYQRTPRSPKRNKPQGLGDIVEQGMTEPERCRSPPGNSGNSDQQNGVCLSPTSNNSKKEKRPNDAQLKRSKSQGTRKLLKKGESTASEGGNGEGIDVGCMGGFMNTDGASRCSSLLTPDRGEGSFTRSRSSSMSSLERESKEAINCLAFAESYTTKTDLITVPCLWVGTSLGSVLVIVITLPSSCEQRPSEPVIVSPSGTVLRLKGAILCMSFLDFTGNVLPLQSEPWREMNPKETPKEKTKRDIPARPKMSPSSSTEIVDRQFVVICSEKQAKVISLPSQTCAYRVKVTETSYALKSDVISMPTKSSGREACCLACYIANGHIMAFAVPSLRPMLDSEYLPLTDYRIARTFCFTNHGQALYLCSPTEMQRVTLCTETSENLQEMLGDLFLPVDTPEAPSKGFFKGLFGGGGGALDREELFGESSGKASKSVAKHIPGTGGMEGVKAASGGVAAELQKARLALNERGEKLGELEDRTAQMMANADNFSQAAHQIMQKYKDKKWYQF